MLKSVWFFSNKLYTLVIKTPHLPPHSKKWKSIHFHPDSIAWNQKFLHRIKEKVKVKIVLEKKKICFSMLLNNKTTNAFA